MAAKKASARSLKDFRAPSPRPTSANTARRPLRVERDEVDRVLDLRAPPGARHGKARPAELLRPKVLQRAAPPRRPPGPEVRREFGMPLQLHRTDPRRDEGPAEFQDGVPQPEADSRAPQAVRGGGHHPAEHPAPLQAPEFARNVRAEVLREVAAPGAPETSPITRGLPDPKFRRAPHDLPGGAAHVAHVLTQRVRKEPQLTEFRVDAEPPPRLGEGEEDVVLRPCASEKDRRRDVGPSARDRPEREKVFVRRPRVEGREHGAEHLRRPGAQVDALGRGEAVGDGDRCGHAVVPGGDRAQGRLLRVAHHGFGEDQKDPRGAPIAFRADAALRTLPNRPKPPDRSRPALLRRVRAVQKIGDGS